MKSRNRQFKDAIYEQFARIGRAVSSPRRLELLDLLRQCPCTVEALADQKTPKGYYSIERMLKGLTKKGIPVGL